MKLYELIDVYDYNRESETKKIQICRPNADDWDDCDEVMAGSALLLPLYNAKVLEVDAIDESVLRVDVEWNKEWFNWGNDNEKKNE